MPIEIPGCNDSERELLFKILLSLPEIVPSGGGDVFGPGSSSNGDIAIFVGASGKIIADSGVNISDVTLGLQSGSQAIGAGVDTIAVVFPTPFTAVPDVVVSISRPVAEGLIDVNIDEASITVAGFTASLGATTPSANFRLKWMAH